MKMPWVVKLYIFSVSVFCVGALWVSLSIITSGTEFMWGILAATVALGVTWLQLWAVFAHPHALRTVLTLLTVLGVILSLVMGGRASFSGVLIVAAMWLSKGYGRWISFRAGALAHGKGVSTEVLPKLEAAVRTAANESGGDDVAVGSKIEKIERLVFLTVSLGGDLPAQAGAWLRGFQIEFGVSLEPEGIDQDIRSIADFAAATAAGLTDSSVQETPEKDSPKYAASAEVLVIAEAIARLDSLTADLKAQPAQGAAEIISRVDDAVMGLKHAPGLAVEEYVRHSSEVRSKLASRTRIA